MKSSLNLKTNYLYYFSYTRIWVIVVVCGVRCVTYLSKLHIIQKYIARLILGEQKYYPSRGLFEELNVISIFVINKSSLGAFCYKLNFGSLSDIFKNFFTKVSHVHGRHTTSQCNLHVRASRTIYVDTSVKYRGTILWNQMKNNINNSYPNVFKKSLIFFLRGSWVTSMWQALFMRLCAPECIYGYFHYDL